MTQQPAKRIPQWLTIDSLVIVDLDCSLTRKLNRPNAHQSSQVAVRRPMPSDVGGTDREDDRALKQKPH